MKQSNPEEPVRTKTAEDLRRALGLPAETGEMEFGSELTCELIRIIHDGTLTHAETSRACEPNKIVVTRRSP